MGTVDENGERMTHQSFLLRGQRLRKPLGHAIVVFSYGIVQVPFGVIPPSGLRCWLRFYTDQKAIGGTRGPTLSKRRNLRIPRRRFRALDTGGGILALSASLCVELELLALHQNRNTAILSLIFEPLSHRDLEASNCCGGSICRAQLCPVGTLLKRDLDHACSLQSLIIVRVANMQTCHFSMLLF